MLGKIAAIAAIGGCFALWALCGWMAIRESAQNQLEMESRWAKPVYETATDKLVFEIAFRGEPVPQPPKVTIWYVYPENGEIKVEPVWIQQLDQPVPTNEGTWKLTIAQRKLSLRPVYMALTDFHFFAVTVTDCDDKPIPIQAVIYKADFQ